jgi:pilus assembly protein CpaE
VPGGRSMEGPMAARILVVDDDPHVQRLLSYTLRQEGFDATVAPDGAEALRLWESQRPDLVILDIMLPKVDGYAVAERIREQESGATHVPIIMLTAEGDVEQRVRGLRAGADDYIMKPFHPAELLARIRSLLARFATVEGTGARVPLGHVIAFYGAKGGVGTTTIAINTAIALHRDLSRSVALVDADLQFGDHRVFLDLGLDRKGIVDIVSAPTIDTDIVRQVLVPHESGIDLLLAPPSPETAELVTPEHITSILQILRTSYDFVVIDLDKRLDEVDLRAFDVADTIYVVMTADLSCLKNVRIVLETLTNLGYEASKVHLVLNRSTAFTGISVKNAEGALRRKIDHQVVNDYRGAISALNSGAPVLQSKSDTTLGRSILDLARQVDAVSTGEAVPVAAKPRR